MASRRPRPKRLYNNKMLVEAAKIYDAKAKIYVLEKNLCKATDLKHIRDITNEIYNLENIIEINDRKLKANIFTRATRSENIPSRMNREFKVTG